MSKDLLVCEADAFTYAKQITPAFGNAYGSSSSLITAVQLDVINGKYKTYGEMNRAYFDAMRKRQSVMKAATDKVADEIVAMYNQEASYKQQALANAVMMTSAMNQSSNSGYNTNSSSTANTYQQPSPKGISSQQIGNQRIYSNGVTSQQIGNQTIYSNGVRCQQIGNQRICN